jgi:hypothetical protein
LLQKHALICKDLIFAARLLVEVMHQKDIHP